MKDFHLAPRARCDLEEIEDYLSRRNPEAGARLLRHLTDAFALFVRQPEIGRSRREIRDCLRSWVVSSYVVYYRVVGEEIEIARILHGARDHSSSFDPLEE